MGMKNIAATIIALVLLGAPSAQAENIEVSPNGDRPSSLRTPDVFTGNVVVKQLFGVTDHSRATGGIVFFAPGSRSNWHTHPAGQTLIITSGTGWVQQDDGEKQVIRPGDVVSIPPGVRHWHGATPSNSMEHIAIQDMVDGRNVDWMEPVSDKDYGK
jgi:quercetin dioxygenase-like cupin family protein